MTRMTVDFRYRELEPSRYHPVICPVTLQEKLSDGVRFRLVSGWWELFQNYGALEGRVQEAVKGPKPSSPKQDTAV